MVSVSIIMTNKLVPGKVGFNCPIFLILIHHSFSWVSMIISKAFSLLPTSLPPKSNPICSLLALGIVMSLSDGLANVSLKYSRHRQTSHVVLGQSTTCVILLRGFLLFNSNPGITSTNGAIAALGGMAIVDIPQPVRFASTRNQVGNMSIGISFGKIWS